MSTTGNHLNVQASADRLDWNNDAADRGPTLAHEIGHLLLWNAEKSEFTDPPYINSSQADDSFSHSANSYSLMYPKTVLGGSNPVTNVDDEEAANATQYYSE